MIRDQFSANWRTEFLAHAPFALVNVRWYRTMNERIIGLYRYQDIRLISAKVCFSYPFSEKVGIARCMLEKKIHWKNTWPETSYLIFNFSHNDFFVFCFVSGIRKFLTVKKNKFKQKCSTGIVLPLIKTKNKCISLRIRNYNQRELKQWSGLHCA